MPELFKFDSFVNSLDKSQVFKKSILHFTDVDNHFFMQLFMGLSTVNLTDKKYKTKMQKKL